MKNLFKFEFNKFFKQKSFYICMAVMIVMSLFGILISKAIEDETTKLGGAYFLLNAVSSSDFTVICGIFIALFVCMDYNLQTIKNVYSRGYSRSQVFFAKYIVCIVANCIMFAAVLLFNIAVGSIFFHDAAAHGNYAGLLVGQFLYCIAYASLVFVVGMITKKSGFTIAIAILGPLVIDLLLTLLDSVIKTETFKISNYWINSFGYDLSNLATSATRLGICIALSCVYAIVFIVAGYFINRKQD